VSAEWIGRGYTELRQLGGGTNGRVVLARDDRSGALVAIRFLPAQLLVDQRRRAAFHAALARFRRLNDVRVVRLRHYAEDPRVARLHQYVAASDGAVLVTDAVEGVPLSRVLCERRALPTQAALVVLKQSLLGLAALHALGLVYQDFKPTRVVIGGRGAATLTDVGVAVLSLDGHPPGKPAYWAPELWSGGPPSPASDVYAATCVFFECLVGERPYRAPELFSLMGGHTVAPVPVQEVPEPLRPLVLDGMAKDPASRPSAAVLAAQLDAVAAWAYGQRWEWGGLAELSAIVCPLLAPFPPQIRRHRARLVAGVAVVVAVVVVVATAATRFNPIGDSTDGAQRQEARPAARILSAPPTLAPTNLTRSSTRTTPAEITPTRTTPAESTPVESTPVESTPVETTPVETTPAETTPAQDPGCPSAPGLSLSPTSGGLSTRITVSGSGVVHNGRVKVYFHADVMGSAVTTGGGCFQVTLPIPNADFYAHFPNQRFEVGIVEYDINGNYVGNGPDGQSFLVTSS
jgi:serine/threonine-protein kinase